MSVEPQVEEVSLKIISTLEAPRGCLSCHPRPDHRGCGNRRRRVIATVGALADLGVLLPHLAGVVVVNVEVSVLTDAQFEDVGVAGGEDVLG
jgi:hypothetical protein